MVEHMTLDEQIEKIYEELFHFEETHQWFAAANALDTLQKLIKLKEYLRTPKISTEVGKTLVENWGKDHD